MSISTVFQICNLLVLPQWLIMIIAPNWQISSWLVKSKIIPVLLAVLYIYFIIGSLNPAGFSEFGSFEGVKRLFGRDELLLAGWIHYLAFDLFVGSWEWRNAKTRHVPHYLIIPSLILTFLLGPVGLLFYLLIRLMYPPQIQAVL